MLIDSHVMVWSERFDPRHHAPSWLSPELAARTYDRHLAEVEDDMDAAGVTGVVLVQTANHLQHTDELLAEARDARRPTRVTGWLPLRQPRQLADALAQFADEPLLTAVRHRVLDSEDPELLLRADTDHGLGMLAAAGLALEVLPWPESMLAQVPIMAERHPDLRIVIDLMGWPDVLRRRMQPWTDHLAAAAAHPRVHIKVAGLERMAHGPVDPDRLRPYTETILELFGPERIMVASDWPTINLFQQPYAEAMATVVRAFGELTALESAQITAGTASRVYRF